VTDIKDFEKQKCVLEKLREAKTNFVEVETHVERKITRLRNKVEGEKLMTN
jgi:hypothetical protein